MNNAPAQELLEQAGEETIFGLIADGETIGSLGKRWGVSRRTFYNWINAGGKERRERLNEAKRLQAEALIDKADDLLDKANELTINVVKEQVKHLTFKAGKLDRDAWGEKPASMNVNVDIGSLHLDALRSIKPALPAAEVPLVLEAEMEEG